MSVKGCLLIRVQELPTVAKQVFAYQNQPLVRTTYNRVPGVCEFKVEGLRETLTHSPSRHTGHAGTPCMQTYQACSHIGHASIPGMQAGTLDMQVHNVSAFAGDHELRAYPPVFSGLKRSQPLALASSLTPSSFHVMTHKA